MHQIKENTLATMIQTEQTSREKTASEKQDTVEQMKIPNSKWEHRLIAERMLIETRLKTEQMRRRKAEADSHERMSALETEKRQLIAKLRNERALLEAAQDALAKAENQLEEEKLARAEMALELRRARNI